MPCREYREDLRFIVRCVPTREVEDLLAGVNVSDMTMDDLEAAYELICGKKPVRPPGYRSLRS
jgi:hypothetical protein